MGSVPWPTHGSGKSSVLFTVSMVLGFVRDAHLLPLHPIRGTVRVAQQQVNNVEFDGANGLEEGFFFGLRSDVIQTGENSTFQFSEATSEFGLESGSDMWHQIVVGDIETEFTFFAENNGGETAASFDLRLQLRDLPPVEDEPWSGDWSATKSKTVTGGDTAFCENVSNETYDRSIRVTYGQWFELDGSGAWLREWIDVDDSRMSVSGDSQSAFFENGTLVTETFQTKNITGTASDSGYSITGTIEKKITDHDADETYECTFQLEETGV